MNKITYYTAYLPEPKVVVDRARRSETAVANNQLGDCARRLDKQTQKLENLDQSCLTNIAKCNRYGNAAREWREEFGLPSSRTAVIVQFGC